MLLKGNHESADEAIVSRELSSFHTSANLLGRLPRFISIWMETFPTDTLHSLFAQTVCAHIFWENFSKQGEGEKGIKRVVYVTKYIF